MMIDFGNELRLRQVISGGQTGADQAGLYAAHLCGIKTGGFAPQGFRTLAGNNPMMLKEEFGLEETTQRNYQVRTAMNVKAADATIRLASNFNSPGEICTMNAIRKYGKPFIDIDLKKIDECHQSSRDEYIKLKVAEVIQFLIANQVTILNVAGNADRSHASGFGFHFHEASAFLSKVFSKNIND